MQKYISSLIKLNGFCQKEHMSFKSLILVGLQVLLALFILISGPVISGNIAGGLVQVAGVVLGLWSVFVMNKSKLNIFPELRKGSLLIKNGPYKIIRHPMYLSILLCLTPLIIDYFSLIRLFALIILFIDLIFKIELEEKILQHSFNDFDNYKKNTRRLFPFVY